MFTYTITGDNDNVTWELNNIWGRIEMQSYGVEWASAPDGWVTTVAEEGLVTWENTNGTWVVKDVPLILQIKSSISVWTNYTETVSGSYPIGVTYGCGVGGHITACGYLSFEHIGPVRPPRFNGITFNASQVTFSIEYMLGSTCFLEKATDLANPDWQPFASFTVTSAYTNYVHALPSNTTDRAFFRFRFE